ncbi:ankyrin repeat-containing domain protein [Gorgonomyces haynaldii]|nr:ankyrin repeat-containing domain protein [Gorgonomyces haynaldii]
MTCYQILTGLVPFHEENQRDIITKWIEKGEVPDRTDNRPVPETVWLLFEACIMKEPAERPKLPEVIERLEKSLYYTHLEGDLLTVAPQRSTEPQASLEERFKEQKLDSRYGSTAELAGSESTFINDQAPSRSASINIQAPSSSRTLNEGSSASQQLPSLHQAARSGNHQLCEDLIRSGVDPNQVDQYGMTALHYASRERHLQVCLSLVTLKADPSIKNQEGMTALDLAQALDHDEIVVFLSKKMPKQPELVKKGSLSWMKQLFQPKPVKEQERLNKRLLKAAENGALQECKDLLEKGADVHCKDKNGWTPLYCAAQNGHRDVCMFLVSKGAYVQARNYNGKTAADLAKGKHSEIYEYLTSLHK